MWFEKGSALPDEFEHSWKDIVIKPCVGANSSGMKHFNTALNEESLREHIRPLSASCGVMLQPCFRSANDGKEIALIYFNGRFSHSIGRPLVGHQTSADEEVAQTFLREPTKAQLDIGGRVLACLPSTPAYIRIDLLPDDEGRDMVLEIEMVEPSLFFRTDVASVSRYADALEEKWLL